MQYLNREVGNTACGYAIVSFVGYAFMFILLSLSGFAKDDLGGIAMISGGILLSTTFLMSGLRDQRVTKTTKWIITLLISIIVSYVFYKIFAW